MIDLTNDSITLTSPPPADLASFMERETARFEAEFAAARMIAATSMRTPLMKRVVCAKCGHFHRPIIAGKCECCGEDAKSGEQA